MLQEYKWHKETEKNKIYKSLEEISENLPFDIKIKEDIVPRWIKKNLPNIGIGLRWLKNKNVK